MKWPLKRFSRFALCSKQNIDILPTSCWVSGSHRAALAYIRSRISRWKWHMRQRSLSFWPCLLLPRLHRLSVYLRWYAVNKQSELFIWKQMSLVSGRTASESCESESKHWWSIKPKQWVARYQKYQESWGGGCRAASFILLGDWYKQHLSHYT